MIAGNFENKYQTKNPIGRILVGNFLKAFRKLLNQTGKPERIAEVGVGEGYLTGLIIEKFPDTPVWASDLSKDIIAVARKNLKGRKVHFAFEDVEKLSYKDKFFDLCVCCEVLEHVENFNQALKEIYRISGCFVIISVPQEPIWRILNVLRLKYLGSLGNTPGHINHWGKKEFIALVKDAGFYVESKAYPLPWQMLLLKKA